MNAATPPAIGAVLPGDQPAAVAARLAAGAEAKVTERIWAKDDTVWGPAGQAEVANRLGWLDIAERMIAQVEDLEAFAAEVAAAGLTDVVLLGMGGSSLAPEVLWRTFGPTAGRPALHLLDSTDAAAVRAVRESVDLEHTLLIVATKSGGTIETLSAFQSFWAAKPDGAHYVAITDPGSSLVDLATRHGFRRTFLNDPDIGGRYSALSYFGLLPAALIGADVRGLLAHAGRASAAARADDGLWLGCALGELATLGKDKLTFVVDEPFASFGLWVEQLVAESTGKHGTGILPVADEPLGAPDVYGEDRVFVHVHNAAGEDRHTAALADLASAGHPVLTLDVGADPAELGALFFTCEYATAVAGWVLGINPFDQPNVQSAKDATKRVLESDAPPRPASASDLDLAELLISTAPSYVAIMAYCAPSDAVDAAAGELRRMLRDTTGMAVTFGYGPRFLHSTGQFHKGGPATGRFLQLVADVSPDEPIPGAEFSFETLKHAQAAGDLQTLSNTPLPAARVTLSGADPAAEIAALTERIKGLI